MKLADLKRGEKARVIGFEGGQGFQRNLEAIGIREDKVVKMLTKHPLGGPVVIKIDNLTITVGRGMSMKVNVERV